MLQIRIALAIAFLITPIASFAQLSAKVRTLPVETLKDIGLVGPRIMDIVQDHDGFIWIATNKALHRYDGYSLKVYRPDKNSSDGLRHGDLLSLFIDSNNYLWIASMEGVSRLNIRDKIFEVMTDLDVSRVPVFKEDSLGRIWYLSNQYPSYYDPADESFIKIDIR